MTYQLDQEVEGVTLQDQVLTVTSELQKSVTLRVTATDASPDAAEPKGSSTAFVVFAAGLQRPKGL